MSLDLSAVRSSISAVVSRVAEIQTVMDEEHRDINRSLLPLAYLWRDPVVSPGPGDVQGEFGSITRTFGWKIRVFVLLDDDAAAQRTVDDITIGLIEQFVADPFLQASGTPAADQAAITNVDPQPVLDVEPAMVLVEATLETVITWTP